MNRQLSNDEDMLVRGALVDNSDTGEFLKWAKFTKATPKQVFVVFEDFLCDRNRAAWEAMSYIIGPHDEPRSIIDKYKALDQSMTNLTRLLLLGLVLHHKALEASSLISPGPLSSFGIYPGDDYLLLPLKKSMDDVFMFQDRIKTTIGGYELSGNTPTTSLLSYIASSALNDRIAS
ncbi:hypothetical protein DER44DRAFT_748398 [Fusarium oxysporum]|nr:hypothetical protein DER44DRAFT_748398 [Fusarium oxysporum]